MKTKFLICENLYRNVTKRKGPRFIISVNDSIKEQGANILMNFEVLRHKKIDIFQFFSVIKVIKQ